MKLGLVATNAVKAICEHTKDIRLTIDELTEGVIVEHPNTSINDIECINTCRAVQNMLARPDLERAFQLELGIKTSTPTSYLYGFIGPKGLSDLLEVSYSTRFMSGDIGPSLGFVQGTAIPVTTEVYQAFPILKDLERVLIEIEYRGEIAFGCSEDYQICQILYGHQTGMFALYTELSQLSAQANFEWCFGKGEYCKVHTNGVSVTTLLSNSPFPVPTSSRTEVIAPVGAEKHLYRVQFNVHEVAFVATWGTDMIEAKRRARRTIENCVSFNPELQYRIDYGYKEQFVLSQPKYSELGGQ